MSNILSSYLIVRQSRTGAPLTDGAAVSTSLIVRGFASCIVFSPFNKYVCMSLLWLWWIFTSEKCQYTASPCVQTGLKLTRLLLELNAQRNLVPPT